MTRGLAIIMHAVRMLIHAPATTLQVILPGMALVLASTLGAYFLIPDTLIAMVSSDPNDIAQIPPSHVLLLLVLGLAALFGYALMAILWHRHVLLNSPDRDQDISPPGGIIAAYLWRAIIVAFVQLLAALPILFSLAAVAAVLGAGSEQGGPSIAFNLLAGSAFVWVALRISITLPAAAMGKPMSIRQSWTVSAQLSGAALAIAALLSLFNIATSVIIFGLIPEPGSFALVLETCVFLLEGLLFVSVLTTLYGHLVEGRPLR